MWYLQVIYGNTFWFVGVWCCYDYFSVSSIQIHFFNFRLRAKVTPKEFPKTCVEYNRSDSFNHIIGLPQDVNILIQESRLKVCVKFTEWASLIGL